MNPSDLLIICIRDLPFEQQYDMMRWYCYHNYKAIRDPAIEQWVFFRAHDTCVENLRRNKK